MNIPRTIRTVVVSVPANADWDTDQSEIQTSSFNLPSSARTRFRPSDLVPWSDPYIAGLVRKLQDEVRSENSLAKGRVTAEAEMPWNEPFEYECEDDYGFTIDESALLG